MFRLLPGVTLVGEEANSCLSGVAVDVCRSEVALEDGKLWSLRDVDGDSCRTRSLGAMICLSKLKLSPSPLLSPSISLSLSESSSKGPRLCRLPIGAGVKGGKGRFLDS